MCCVETCRYGLVSSNGTYKIGTVEDISVAWWLRGQTYTKAKTSIRGPIYTETKTYIRGQSYTKAKTWIRGQELHKSEDLNKKSRVTQKQRLR